MEGNDTENKNKKQDLQPTVVFRETEHVSVPAESVCPDVNGWAGRYPRTSSTVVVD